MTGCCYRLEAWAGVMPADVPTLPGQASPSSVRQAGKKKEKLNATTYCMRPCYSTECNWILDTCKMLYHTATDTNMHLITCMHKFKPTSNCYISFRIQRFSSLQEELSFAQHPSSSESQGALTYVHHYPPPSLQSRFPTCPSMSLTRATSC